MVPAPTHEQHREWAQQDDEEWQCSAHSCWLHHPDSYPNESEAKPDFPIYAALKPVAERPNE